MFSIKKSDALLEMIRDKRQMTGGQKMSLIVWLSVPGILAQITTVLMFYIDAAMVGHLGAKESASIGLIESSTWLFGSITNAAAMGFAVQVAHFIGANDFVKARAVFRHGILCTLLFSLLMALFGVTICGRLPYWLGGGSEIAGDATIYFFVFMLIMPFFQLSTLSGAMLKSSGDMRIPSIMSILMCVLDVGFNYVFIFIFHLGVLGAAMGTALSVIIGGLGQVYFAVFRNKILALRKDRERFVWNGGYVLNAMKISLPMAAQSLLMGGAQIVSTIIVAPLGIFAIAANSFAVTAESLCYMPGYGIGEAATTLIGQSIGAGQHALTKSFARMTIWLGMSVMAFMGVLMYVFAPEMIGFLSPVNEIRSLGITVLRIEAFAEPFFAASIVGYSICVGAGDTLRPAIMNLFSMWIVRLTLAAMLAPRYGLPGVWFAMAVELTFRGTIFLIRIYSGKWLKET
ncbi:MATE family efflux transporter [Prevotella sp. OH937_COT-195]|uniref:MATE family efflux transporter n=1 Tax=Prevotella sp. OH937_COT-195 TaxID=2491051 RepID=UPI000F65207D|nr:MATE family efflux transporter [Prevotella sp. OH937_COT-195]RRD02437.1 MATE family efflux transporter [Prevotella sp. OH937_COT-195]